MDPTAEGAAGAEGLPAVPWFLASRRRLSLTLFLALAAPMAGLGLIAAERARRTLRDQALTQDAAAAGLAAQMVGEHFAGLARHLEVVARRPALVDAAGRKDAAAARAQLRDLLELDPSFDRAFVADAAGVEWADEPTDPAAIGQDLSARDWYRGASGTGATYVSGVGRRSGGKRIMTVAVATPIRDARGGTAGYLVAHHPLGAVTAWLAQIRPSAVGPVALIDRHGTLAREPGPGEDRATTLGDDPVVRDVLAGRSGSREAADPISGVPSLVSYAPVRPIGWGVLARQPVAAVFAPVEALRRAVWLIALACLVPMLGLGGLWLDAIRRFHAALRERTERLGRAFAELHRSHRELGTALAELKEAQGRMLQQAKMASLGQTAAGVAHEINNPLAFVTNNIVVLRREVAGLHDILLLYRQAEDTLALYQAELLGQIHDMADRMDLPFVLGNLDHLMERSREGLRRIQKIVADLRDFARLDEAELKEADLNDGVATIVGLMRGLAERRGVSLTADLSAIPRLTCCPAKLNLVVQNLVSNAIDACGPGGEVVVRTRPADGGAEVEVADTGSGIDPAIRDRVFDPFFTTKPIGQGTGLGLSMSYGVVKDHGGTIDFDSTPGRGTRFVVRLPAPPSPRGGAAVVATGRVWA